MPIHPNGLPDFMLEPLNVWYRRWLRRVGFNWMPEGFQRYCGLVWIARRWSYYVILPVYPMLRLFYKNMRRGP